MDVHFNFTSDKLVHFIRSVEKKIYHEWSHLEDHLQHLQRLAPLRSWTSPKHGGDDQFRMKQGWSRYGGTIGPEVTNLHQKIICDISLSFKW